MISNTTASTHQRDSQRVKHPPDNAGQTEVQVRSLGLEDSLEKVVTPTSVFLLRKSQGQRSPVGCSAWGSQRVGCDGANTYAHYSPKYAVFLPYAPDVLFSFLSIADFPFVNVFSV